MLRSAGVSVRIVKKVARPSAEGIAASFEFPNISADLAEIFPELLNPSKRARVVAPLDWEAIDHDDPLRPSVDACLRAVTNEIARHNTAGIAYAFAHFGERIGEEDGADFARCLYAGGVVDYLRFYASRHCNDTDVFSAATALCVYYCRRDLAYYVPEAEVVVMCRTLFSVADNCLDHRFACVALDALRHILEHGAPADALSLRAVSAKIDALIRFSSIPSVVNVAIDLFQVLAAHREFSALPALPEAVACSDRAFLVYQRFSAWLRDPKHNDPPAVCGPSANPYGAWLAQLPPVDMARFTAPMLR